MKKITEDWLISAECDLLILLDQLYIDARYPGELGLLPNGKPSISEAKGFYNLGRQVFEASKSTCN